MVIDNFKAWLPTASSTLRLLLEKKAQQEEGARKEQLRHQQNAEEQRLRVMRNIRI